MRSHTNVTWLLPNFSDFDHHPNEEQAILHQMLLSRNLCLASCHGKSKETRFAMQWYVLSHNISQRLIDNIDVGTRYKSFHQATFIGSVQTNFGITQEVACLCTDGRLLQDGEYHDVHFPEEGLSSTSFRDGTDPPPHRRLPTLGSLRANILQ
jgi:hypothetical protein